jgi:uncharacterized membrane protein
VNRTFAWLGKHWIAMVVGILLVYSLLPFVAPALMKAGFTRLAQAIYLPYQGTCHTYGFRSLWLFGPQVSYPRGTPDAPGPFNAASGINTFDPSGPLQARNFQGNEQMGYKVALCERDIAIYFSMALNGALFGLLHRRWRRMPWWLLVALGVGPIALDGFSQLLSQPPFGLIAYRESTLTLRLITGGLFGAAAAWFVFPLVQSTME